MSKMKLSAGALVAATVVIAAVLHYRPEPDVRFESRSTVIGESGASATVPQLAWSVNGNLYFVTAVERNGRRELVEAISRDGGDSVEGARTISSAGASVMARGEMSPVLRVHGGKLYALWEQSSSDGPTEIVSARSDNEGWIANTMLSVVSSRRSGQGFEGFANLAVAPDGDLLAVWLDGSDEHRAAGRFDVMLAQSRDGGASWGPGVRVAQGSCPCCRPAVAADSEGRIYVAWRKVYPGDQRDLALSVSDDGGRSFHPPQRLGNDHWTLHACPESGPALAVTRSGVFVAWYSGGGQPGIRVAHAAVGDSTFSIRDVAGAVADQNHPRFAIGPGDQVWLGFEGRGRGTGARWSPLRAFVTKVSPQGRPGLPVAAGGEASQGAAGLAAGSEGQVFVADPVGAGAASRVILVRGRS